MLNSSKVVAFARTSITEVERRTNWKLSYRVSAVVEIDDRINIENLAELESISRTIFLAEVLMICHH